jgi:hypothetical protein
LQRWWNKKNKKKLFYEEVSIKHDVIGFQDEHHHYIEQKIDYI